METVDINQFDQETTCTYKGESYSVRDNGAIYRHRRPNKRKRPLDEIWTFGKPSKERGYMYLSSEVVHRIVATAFLGEPPTDQHVVDHIDTNRRNNRPENLRWITKLENLLLNPITRSRIIFRYGSLESFFENPKNPINGSTDPNTDWMRTVTKEEADNALKNLLKWAQEGNLPGGEFLGDWVFSAKEKTSQPVPTNIELVESLTPNAVQKSWKTPSTFSLCPQSMSENPILDYAENLKVEAVFSNNQYGASIITDFAISDDKATLWVMCQSSDTGAIKPWSLAKVFFENGLFVHESLGSFFKQDGAVKNFTLAQGLEWTGGDVFDGFA